MAAILELAKNPFPRHAVFQLTDGLLYAIVADHYLEGPADNGFADTAATLLLLCVCVVPGLSGSLGLGGRLFLLDLIFLFSVKKHADYVLFFCPQCGRRSS